MGLCASKTATQDVQPLSVPQKAMEGALDQLLHGRNFAGCGQAASKSSFEVQLCSLVRVPSQASQRVAGCQPLAAMQAAPGTMLNAHVAVPQLTSEVYAAAQNKDAVAEQSPASTEPIKSVPAVAQHARSGRARRLSTLPTGGVPGSSPDSGAAASPQSTSHAGRKRRLSVVSSVRAVTLVPTPCSVHVGGSNASLVPSTHNRLRETDVNQTASSIPSCCCVYYLVAQMTRAQTSRASRVPMRPLMLAHTSDSLRIDARAASFLSDVTYQSHDSIHARC